MIVPSNVLVTGPSLVDDAVRLLIEAGHTPVYVPPYTRGDALLDAVRDADPVGIIVRMGRLDEAALDAAPNLRVLSKHGVGVDNIDLNAASARGVPVLVASGANAVSVAEHAMALLLAVIKRIVPLDRSLREGRWEKPGFQGRELAGSTLGLVGFGAIARQTGVFARVFGLQVQAFDPFAPAEAFAEDGVERVEDLDRLLATSDIVSLHCPLTPSTKHLLSAASIARMKPGAVVVNTARGGLIDEAALLEALRSGHLAGAGLDTFETEPPAADHPFWADLRIVGSPHIGGVTTAANSRVGVEAAQGVIDVLAGRSVPSSRIVNRAGLLARQENA